MFGLIIILAAIGNSNMHEPAIQDPSNANVESSASAKLTASMSAMKKVDEKYRYFFDVSNEDTKPFIGKMKILLFNKQSDSWMMYEGFDVAIDPGVHKVFYIDTFTGPESVHGEFGISRFEYEAILGSKTVQKGKGEITQ